jgi:hypothetical protein
MEGVTWQLGALVLIFFLVVILGLQIQISSLCREIDELQERNKAG